MKRTLTACLSLCLALAAQAELRVWKDASGAHEIKAELVSVQGGKVTLKRENGTTVTLPVASLSKADQALLGGGGSGGSATGDWPQWRGPNRDDVSQETGLLKKWPSGGPKRVWVSEDAGLGYSGFAVVGGKLYTMGLYDAEEKLICLDTATGKKVWESPVGAIYKNKWVTARAAPRRSQAARCMPSAAMVTSSAPMLKAARRSGPSASSRTWAVCCKTGATPSPRWWMVTSSS